MGAVIIGTGISRDGKLKSAIAHAAEAGKKAIENAKIEATEVDVVINVGIYREDNMVEPAMAAIIQKELGINLDYVKASPRRAAFSFDLMNGGIGALDALKVADAILQSDSAKYVLIVGADIHPSGMKASDFPFAEVGSAILLKKGTDKSKGVIASHFASKPHKFAGRTGMVKTKEMGTTGRSHIVIADAPDYVEAITDFTVTTTKEFMQKQNLKGDSIQLISSQVSASHVATLQDALQIKNSPNLFKEFGGDTHSATYGLGLHQLSKAGAMKAGEKILLAGGSSGLAAGCILYVC